MSDNSLSVCPECGSFPGDGMSCREKFEDALALEFGGPSVFSAVHRITVICYNLQHPGDFSEAALVRMESTLHSIIADGITGAEMRDEARKKYNGSIKINRQASSDKTNERISWSMTIMDVHMENTEVYTKDVMTRAKSILSDIHNDA